MLILKTGQIHRILALLLLAAVLLSVHSSRALGEGTSSDTESIYRQMLAMFAIGHEMNSFDSAIAIYEDNPQLKKYKDAEEYYRYMVARQYLLKGYFEDAALLFQSLISSGLFTDEKDAAAYCSYANARIAEKEGRYADAVSLYIEAMSIPTLDCVVRMKRCNDLSRDEKRKEDYENAVSEFDTAMGNGDKTSITELRKVFVSMGDYRAATEYAAACDTWLQLTDTMKAAEKDGQITVSWQDHEADHFYSMLYMPENCSEGIVLDQCVSPVTLSDLIPNTDYLIRITDSRNALVKAETRVHTPASEKITDSELKLRSPAVIGITRDETILENVSLSNIYDLLSDYYCEKNDQIFTVSEATEFALHSLISYKNMTGKEIDAAVVCVLRSSLSGVYISQPKSYYLSSSSEYYRIWVNLDELIDKVRDEYHSIPADQYAWEVYLNGKYLCGGIFTIVK